jgi:hypothetical protein
MFEYRFIRFQYSHERKIFEPLVFNSAMPFTHIKEQLSQGVSESSDNPNTNYLVQKLKYGPCDIIIPDYSFPKLVVDEILNPFYLFQVQNFKCDKVLDFLLQLVVLGAVLCLRRRPSRNLYHLDYCGTH